MMSWQTSLAVLALGVLRFRLTTARSAETILRLDTLEHLLARRGISLWSRYTITCLLQLQFQQARHLFE